MLEGLSLQVGRITLDVIHDFRLEHEEPPVDPSFSRLWLLGEFAYERAIQRQTSKASRRSYGGNGRELFMLFVEAKDGANIDISDAIAIGDHEARALQPIFEAQEASPSSGVKARVDDRK